MVTADLRPGERLGKYRIRRRLERGGFATVYEGLDTVEGARVAIKVPHAHLLSRELLQDFYREVRLAARLDHPNILKVKNADFIGDRFVIVLPLGEETLADRWRRRMGVEKALDLAEQTLAAVAHAHRHRVIHCDLKPENLILFPGNRLRLADFGIAKVAQRTVRASGSGTVGYIAPEQAMGRPSHRSDVFSLGLILYRLFSGRLPEWPFRWPPPGLARLRGKVGPEILAVIRRALELEPRRRFADAGAMLQAFLKARGRRARPARLAAGKRGREPGQPWEQVRHREFGRRFGRALGTRHRCAHCSGPVGEVMRHCPWCGKARAAHRGPVAFPARCPRCGRGVKLDWRYCPWCWGAGFDAPGARSYSDVRYRARCSNPTCPRRDLMPFMRYCPWCHKKVERRWRIEGSAARCRSCGWGVAGGFWRHCAWCGKRLMQR